MIVLVTGQHEVSVRPLSAAGLVGEGGGQLSLVRGGFGQGCACSGVWQWDLG